MKIGILGSGNVGTALANAWIAAGHDVRVGARQPTAAQVSLRDAATADIVVLATPWGATMDLVRGLDLSGRIVIDATNPVSVSAAGLQRLATQRPSGAEDIATAAPGAFVFKTLNQAGANVLGAARRAASMPLMFVAGDDASRKRIVLGLVADIGFDARDAGPLANAAWLESLACLWIHQALTSPAGRDFAIAAVPWHA